MKINYTIEELLEDKEVELTLNCSVQNDSFSHAFGTETYPDYIRIDEVTYDKADFTPEEQAIIEKWIDDNDDTLNEHTDNSEPDYDGPDPDDYEPEQEEDSDFDYGYNQYDKHYDY